MGGGAGIGGNLDATKQAALKEELYRDLTGLIVNSVKRRDGEDEYNCIQTGKNGSEFPPLFSLLLLPSSNPIPYI